MKLLGLFFLLIVGLAVCLTTAAAYAQDAGNQPSTAARPAAPDSNWHSAAVVGGAEDRLIFKLDSDQPDSLNNACAFMRTYRVKRRWRGSDAVSPAGYRTCVPVRRFEMRSAVETR